MIKNYLNLDKILMKKILLVLIFFSLIYFLNLYASGPPVDTDGNISTDYIALKISKEQLELVGNSRVFKLEKNQLAILKKLNVGFPEVIRIITPSFQECSCNLATYGIWNKRDQICIVFDQIMRDKIDADKNLMKEKANDLTKNTAYVYVNDKAEIFLNRKKITPDNLKDIIKKLISIKESSKIVYINLPPRIDKETNEKIIQLFIDLEKFGKKFNVAVYEDG